VPVVAAVFLVVSMVYILLCKDEKTDGGTCLSIE
jgi:hypothetical protein